MSVELIIILVLMASGFGGIFWFLSKRKEPAQDQGSFLMLQNLISDITKTLDSIKRSITALVLLV